MTNLLNNIHVINLERSKDRLQHINTNFNKYGIKFKRFDAIDGKQLSIDEINNTTTKMCRYFLCNRSIIGCAMSHIALWKEISESDNKWHLVLEDDIEFTDETINFLKKIQNSSIMNEDNIIISLNCTGPLCTGQSVSLHFNVNDEIHNIQKNIEKNKLIQPDFPLGTVAYLITKNTAKKLYDYYIENKINYHIDFQTAWNLSKLGIKYLTTENYVVNLTDDNNNSTIGSGKILYILSNILNSLGLSKFVWYLSVPILTINLSTVINGFILLFILLLLLNFFFIQNILLYIYLLLELVIAFILNK